MTQDQIKAAIAAFIREHKLPDDSHWNASTHNAFFRTLLRDVVKLTPEQLGKVREIHAEMPGLGSNSSGTRQWLVGEEMLEKAPKVSTRYNV